jgi:hypothetical protein
MKTNKLAYVVHFVVDLAAIESNWAAKSSK